jgi:ribosomal protein S18 acetylase RimI-like enzyme
MIRTQLDWRAEAPKARPPALAERGGAVEIRAASAADHEAIKSFVNGLSLRSRFLRFFSPVAPPTSAVLRGMCGAGPGTDALVATADGLIVGHVMASDVTGPDGRRPVADIGLVVADRWQGLGLGSQLLSRVIARAAARGVSGLVMEVLPENRRTLAMIARRFADAGYEFGGGSVTVRAQLPGAAAAGRGRWPTLPDRCQTSPRRGCR